MTGTPSPVEGLGRRVREELEAGNWPHARHYARLRLAARRRQAASSPVLLDPRGVQ